MTYEWHVRWVLKALAHNQVTNAELDTGNLTLLKFRRSGKLQIFCYKVVGFLKIGMYHVTTARMIANQTKPLKNGLRDYIANRLK